ncbi:MAG TPA: hypothetical protein P5191_10680 [Ruminococcus sp.]|nr:hypothetical protein [Ruminococcus sp.]
MNKKDMFFESYDIDLETANKVSAEYPSLSKSAKERMFNMAKKKMNTTINFNETKNSSVNGVENYNRPRWIKFAGMAAAFAVIAGGIGGGSYLLHNMNKSAPGTSASSVTEVEVTSTSVTTTDAVVETTTTVTEASKLTPEEAAHKLTDSYWEYEGFFGMYSHSKSNQENDVIKLNCDFSYPWETHNQELTYCKVIDERLTDKTMNGLKNFYYTYFSKTYDPFYSPNAEYTNNYELFGPSYTAATLPADGKLDRAYTFIEYEGELYQNCPSKDYLSGYYWVNDQTEISDVTETSFTLKRKYEKPADAMSDVIKGEVTFKVVFDEDVQDWRIEQKDDEAEYEDTSATTQTDNAA